MIEQAAGHGLRRRPRDLLRHPLAWVLAASALVRAYTLLGLSVSLGYSDSGSYVQLATGDPGLGIAPPGYALFMRFVHLFSSSVELLLAAQHVLVLAAAVAVYGMARELGCRRGTAAAAAGVLALCGNLLATAQGILTETLFVTLVSFAGWGAVRSFRRGRCPDLAMLGAFAGLAITVRTVGIPMLLVLGVCVAVAAATWALRAGRAAIIGGSALVAILVVVLLSGSSAGLPGAGSTASGWALYGRIAQFADCPATYVEPPLRSLCPSTAPEEQRQGPDYWRVLGGPAFERFGGAPNGDDDLEEFALAAIRHEPLEYARTVFVDTMRFFTTNFGQERDYAGAGWDELELDRPLDPAAAAFNKAAIEKWYSAYTPRSSSLGVVRRYQELTTLTPGLWMALGILALLGPLLAAGRRRWAGATVLLGGGALLVSATALNQYVARYALPSLGLLLPVAALGFEGLARRVTSAPEETVTSGGTREATPPGDEAKTARMPATVLPSAPAGSVRLP